MKKILISIAVLAIVLVVYGLLAQGGVFNNKQDISMTLDLESATVLAQEKINENNSHTMAIKKVEENEQGWIFYYDTEEAVATGDPLMGVPGNTPLFIGKDGSVRYMSHPNLSQ